MIRKATVADRAAIVALVGRCPYTSAFRMPMFSSEQSFANRRNFVGVAEHAGRIVGFVSGRNLVREPRTILDFIYVLPSRRRTRIGAKLVEWAATQATHTHLSVHVKPDNAQSIKFCKSAGLEISGVVEQGRAREPVLLLQKAV